MKSKFVFGLLAVMVVVAMAPSSFAQVNIQIFNPPALQEIKTNHTVETSDPLSSGAGIQVTGSLIANSNLSTTWLTLTFPTAISTDALGTVGGRDLPAGDGIRILAATGLFSSATIITRVGNNLTISLIGETSAIIANGNSGSFRVLGTRIEGNGLTTPASATASLNSSANNFILSTTSFPVVNAVGDGIASIKQDALPGTTNNGPMAVFTNKNASTLTTTVVVTEGFNFAWRSNTQNRIDNPCTNGSCTGGASGVGATFIRLTFSGIPATSTIAVGALTSNTANASFGIASGATTNLSSSNNTTVIEVLSSDPNAIDAFQLTLGPITSPTSTPSVGSITVTASMFPTTSTSGFATSVANAAGSTTSGVTMPRFLTAEVGPATVGNIVASSTTMLIPLVEKVAGFDTGISIANTTRDPFGAGSGGATEGAGTMIIDFFPSTATGTSAAFSLTTSATVRPGLGLAADGTLPAGGTWRVLVSELLTAAGQSGDFVGYVFIRTNFLLAHGQATISDFKTYSLAANVLVLPAPASNSRASLNLESLNQ